MTGKGDLELGIRLLEIARRRTLHETHEQLGGTVVLGGDKSVTAACSANDTVPVIYVTNTEEKVPVF